MSKKPHKLFLWLPYISDITLKGKSVRFVFKGGKIKVNWNRIHSIMLYGNIIPLEQEFLEKCAFYKIPIVIHRRNMVRAVWIGNNYTSNREDLLTKQILVREDYRKRLHIVRRLLLAKFKSMAWLIAPPTTSVFKLKSLEELRNLEANHAQVYWNNYYKALNINSNRRHKDNIATTLLDATSKFVSSIILRWVHFHHLSPYHGFLHESTEYPSLVYDFFEPLRGYFDKVVFDTVREFKSKNLGYDGILSITIDKVKKFFDKKTYVHTTRQIVSIHELLHGVVLAFRAYLQRDAYRFIVPLPSKPKSGRPIKAGFVLYGHKAGMLDFWGQAKYISKEFHEVYHPKAT